MHCQEHRRFAGRGIPVRALLSSCTKGTSKERLTLGQCVNVLLYVVQVEIIRLEKRLDDELYYLRDAPHDIQTFPFDMEPEILPEGVPVPLNKTVIKLNPKPWTRYWERRTDRLVGYTYDSYDDHPNALSWKMKSELHHLYLNYGWQRAVEKYDLMLHYRETIPVEEQDAIWAEVGDELEERDVAMRKVAAKRAFSKPQRRH